MNRIVAGLLAIPRFGRKLWGRITVEGATKIALLSLSVFIILGVYNTQQQRSLSKTNRQILYTIQEQTSPKALAEREQTINAIIDVVDCRNQASLQRVIDVLVEREVLDPGDARAITDYCEKYLKDN